MYLYKFLWEIESKRTYSQKWSVANAVLCTSRGKKVIAQ